MPVTGQRLVAANIIRFGGGFVRHTNVVMEGILKILDKKVTENISLTDHSLKDLKILGHPYATKHGRAGKSLHNPNYQVHKQSGKLLSAKRAFTTKASIAGGRLQASANVLLDETKAAHVLPVIFGTSKMIPRPVLQGSGNQVRAIAFVLIRTQLKGLTFTLR